MKQWGFAYRSGLAASLPVVSTILGREDLRHDDGGDLRAFFVVDGRAALLQNSSKSSPLSRMKLVISRKAWYVTTCLRGMI
jgi:hypothetical protein